MNSLNPCLVNVDNTDQDDIIKGLNKHQTAVGDNLMFYRASLRFKDALTQMLGQSLKEIKTINVKVKFSKIGEARY